MLPKVVIVGRPNVGKSSLMNLLAGRLISIVDPTAGVTRDRVSTLAEVPGEQREDPPHYIELIDTGGYGIEDTQNLTADVERQIAVGMAEADLVLFVVDAQSGLVALDEEVAQLLRKAQAKPEISGKRILLVANKVDGPTHEAAAYEAARLGFGTPVTVSAATGYHKQELIDELRGAIDFERFDAGARPEQGMLLAIVGKRNAGKSTLVNALAGSERVIVSELEGTTRDSVDVRFEIAGKVFTAIDTAGVRKAKAIQGKDIEFYSYHRSLRSLRRADVVLLLLDATVPVSQVDKQLSNEVQKHFKPVVIVVNKWDLAAERSTQDEYIEYLDKTLQGLDFAPVAFISAKNDEGLRDVVAMALNLHQQAGHRVPTAELNRVVEEIIKQKAPSSPSGKRPKIYYVTQLDVHPPTIGLFVNNLQMFDPSYQRFLINRFRETLPFSEVPIKLLIRGRRTMPGRE